MKKGFFQEHILFYAIIIVVAVLVLLLTFRGVKTLEEKAAHVNLASFKTDLEGAVSLLSAKKGTVEHRTYDVGAYLVCILDNNSVDPESPMLSKYPYIMDSIQTANSNLFIYSDKETLQEFYIPNMVPMKTIDPYYNCFTTNNVDLTLEGIGKKTSVSRNVEKGYNLNTGSTIRAASEDSMFFVTINNEVHANATAISIKTTDAEQGAVSEVYEVYPIVPLSGDVVIEIKFYKELAKGEVISIFHYTRRNWEELDTTIDEQNNIARADVKELSGRYAVMAVS